MGLLRRQTPFGPIFHASTRVAVNSPAYFPVIRPVSARFTQHGEYYRAQTWNGYVNIVKARLWLVNFPGAGHETALIWHVCTAFCLVWPVTYASQLLSFSNTLSWGPIYIRTGWVINHSDSIVVSLHFNIERPGNKTSRYSKEVAQVHQLYHQHHRGARPDQTDFTTSCVNVSKKHSQQAGIVVAQRLDRLRHPEISWERTLEKWQTSPGGAGSAQKCTICSITHDTRQELTLHNALIDFATPKSHESGYHKLQTAFKFNKIHTSSFNNGPQVHHLLHHPRHQAGVDVAQRIQSSLQLRVRTWARSTAMAASEKW